MRWSTLRQLLFCLDKESPGINREEKIVYSKGEVDKKKPPNYGTLTKEQ